MTSTFDDRIQERVREEEPERQAGEYVVVGGSFGTHMMTRSEGARVAGLLARWWTPRWVEFEDASGSIVRLRSRDINEMYDLAPGIRRATRAIRGALQREDDADGRGWDD